MSHYYGIHNEDSQHRHMESGYIWRTDPVRSHRFDTPIETHANEVAFWRMWFETNEKIINHLIDKDITLSLTPSVKPTKKGQWWNKDTPCDCLECAMGENLIDLQNDVRISKATTEVTYNGKKYTIKNATIIKALADNLESNDNGVWSPDYSEVIKDIWSTIKVIESKVPSATTDFAKVKSDVENLKNQINKFKGGTATVLEQIWTGKVNDGGVIPVTLTNGNYQIFIENPECGSFSLRLPWSQKTELNSAHAVFTLPLSHYTNGSFGIVRCTINAGTAGNRPKIRFAEIRVDANGKRTYLNEKTKWYIKIIKRERQVTIG